MRSLSVRIQNVAVMKLVTVIARVAPISVAVILFFNGTASADGCNLANIILGKVRIELIPHDGYETGINFGNDFDSKRFSYYKILGQIASSERDGSRRITDVNGELCGVLLKDLNIDTSDGVCAGCSKEPKKLIRISPKAYGVMVNDSIMGTIEGRLNK